MAMRLSWNEDGYLASDVLMRLEDLLDSPFVTGDGVPINKWNETERRRLAENLTYVVAQLRNVGFCGETGVNGSFGAAQCRCRDVDVYCKLGETDLQAYDTRLDRLNEIERADVWQFHEEACVRVNGVAEAVSPLWKKYGVDLRFDYGQFSGIFGAGGERLTYSQAFRQQRNSHYPKGVIILT
jgi:hypothetical protein